MPAQDMYPSMPEQDIRPVMSNQNIHPLMPDQDIHSLKPDHDITTSDHNLLNQSQSPRDWLGSREQARRHPVSPVTTPSMGGPFGIAGQGSLDALRIQREEKWERLRRSNPFRPLSPPARARSLSPQRFPLPFRIRPSPNQSSPDSVGSSPRIRLSNQDIPLPPITHRARCGPSSPSSVDQYVVLPPIIDRSRRGPGISSPTNRDVVLPSIIDRARYGPGISSSIDQDVLLPPIIDRARRGPSSWSSVNQDVVLPSIINGARGPGISSPTDGDGQPCARPSFSPQTFNLSVCCPPMHSPPHHPAWQADTQHQPGGRQRIKESNDTEDRDMENSELTDDEDQNQEEQTPLCEFAMPCRMGPSPDGMHYRKVISHVFGRNKAMTKLFPEYVWVQYCRKHYQRARYRADQWPFTQCELLLESLRRMEEWGGVMKFKLTLRRREQLRVEGSDDVHKASGASSSATLPSGRKHPTAVTSPVPDWLLNLSETTMSFDDIRALILQIREYMIEMRDEEKSRLAEEAGVDEKGAHKEVRHQMSRVRFPDIEILPTFNQWVLDAALRQREQRNHGQGTEAERDDREGHPNNNNNIKGDEDSHDEGEVHAAEIGRAGTNSGRSPRERRRSQRNFVKLVSGVTRVSPAGAVKKPQPHKK